MLLLLQSPSRLPNCFVPKNRLCLSGMCYNKEYNKKKKEIQIDIRRKLISTQNIIGFVLVYNQTVSSCAQCTVTSLPANILHKYSNMPPHVIVDKTAGDKD